GFSLNARSNQGPEIAPSGRDSRGRFAKENRASLTHGVTSRAMLLAESRRELRTAILIVHGYTNHDVPHVLSIAVDRLVEAHLIASAYFEFLASTGGVITSKGRQRRAVEGWSRACDRVAKFATMLGLERRPRQVHETPIAWLERI